MRIINKRFLAGFLFCYFFVFLKFEQKKKFKGSPISESVFFSFTKIFTENLLFAIKVSAIAIFSFLNETHARLLFLREKKLFCVEKYI